MAKKETAKTATKKVADVKAPKAAAAPKAVKEPKPEVYMPMVGVIARFQKGGDNFLGEIQSFDPLELVCHDVINTCHRTELLNVTSLDGYTITPVTRLEVMTELY